MSIIIGKIANKFWSNSGHKFPNSFPIYEHKKELKDVLPQMNDYTTGTVYLYGKEWNHCIYEGIYYNLYIVQLIDLKREFYVYRLERDFWFEVLKLQPTVVGDLITSNDDKLLEENINRTFSAIDNPAKVITINFDEVDFDWRKNFEFKAAADVIPQKVLASEDYNRFLDSLNSPIVVERKKLNKWFYSEQRNPAVFIIDILEPSIINYGWKNILRKKINEFVKGIKESPENSLKISKVELTGNNYASPLNGKYCITHVVDGISVSRESKNYRLIEIDLSKLKDIVPINIHDLHEVTPSANILKGERAGVFHKVDQKSEYNNFFAKIKRKAYVPYGASEERRPAKVGYGFNSNWNNVKNPQKISWKYKGEIEKEEYLWWLDNINFIAHNDGGENFFSFISYQGGWYEYLSNYLKQSKFPLPHPKPWSVNRVLDNLEKDQIVPLGFFIFQIYRNLSNWFLFEYRGFTKLKSVEYINGIKEKFIEEYRKDDERWKALGFRSKNTKKSNEFIRFYLDVNQFTWLSILAHSYKSYQPYLAEDYWGTYGITNYKYYVADTFYSDLYNSSRKSIEQSFFSKDRYPNFRNRREKRLRDLLNFGSYELPKDVEIQKGDYFFSDLDYEIIPYKNVLFGRERGKEWVSIASNFDKVSSYRLIGNPSTCLIAEDFQKEENVEAFIANRDVIALCTTLEGNIDIRKISSFEGTLDLHKAKEKEREIDEIVRSVEGGDQIKTNFTLMKKLSDPLMPEVGEFQLSERIKASLLKSFYQSLGYNVLGEGEVFWNWFIEEDFSEGSTKQLLFDLVGTDWYCFITKGKISLISKKEELFVEEEKKVTTLKHEENEDLNLSLIEKVNQKVRLHFYTSIYYLNWKTTFSDKDNLLLYSKVLKPSVQQTQFEQHFVHLDTKFDLIYYENVSVPKRVDKALSLGDSLAVQRMNMDLARAQYSYQIDQDRLALSTKRYEENITRAQRELENQKAKSLITAGASLFTTGLGSAMTFKHNFVPIKFIPEKYKASSTYKDGDWHQETIHIPLNDATPPGNPWATEYTWPDKPITATAFGGIWFDTKDKVRTKKIIPAHFKKNLNWIGTPGLGFGGLLATGAKLAYNWGFQFPEQARQINVEKQLGAHELGIASLTIDTNYMDRQITAQQQLNALTNLYTNPNIGEREVMDDYLKQEAWHKKTLNNIYLSVFIPSAEQLIALSSFKEEFGVMCDIPNVKIQFIEHMNPDVIRYRNLDDQAIQGIKDLWVREFFKAHLLAGIKIVEFEESQSLAPIEKIIVAKEKLEGLRRELDDTKLLLEQKTSEITQLKETCQTDKQTLEERLKGECSEDKDKLQKSIQDKEKELTNTKILLDEKSNEITQLKEQFEQEKKTIEQKLKDEREKEVKQTREQLEEEHNKKLRDFLTQRDEAVAAAKRAGFESREGEVKELKNQLEKCGETDKSVELQAKLDSYTEREKEYCDLLKKYLQDRYEVNLNEREDGGNALRDLVIEIIQEVSWMRRANLDTKLGSAFPTLRPLLDGLMKLQEVPLIARWQDIVEDNFYPDYLKFLREGGSHNGNVDKIIKKVNDIKLLDLENVAAAHGIKATLDELNWLAYKAKNQLNEPLKTNSDLQYFFKHIYPAGSLDKYQKLYGDPNIAIVKRKYIEQMQCFKGEGELPYTNLEVLSNFEKTTRITVDDVVTDQTNQREEEQNFVPSYYKPLSIKKEDIAVYAAPKYTQNAKFYIKEIKILNNKNTWKELKGYPYFSKLRITNETNQELDTTFMRVLEEINWVGVMANRNFLWQNRRRINIPKEKLKRRLEFSLHSFRRGLGAFRILPSDDNINVDLAKIFGSRYVNEAVVLLAIMSTNGLVYFPPEPIYSPDPWKNNYPNYITNFRTYQQREKRGDFTAWTTVSIFKTGVMAAHRNLKELTDYISWPDTTRRHLGLLFEFSDLWNLFSYVYRHIKLGLTRLEDPFGPDYSDTSKVNLPEVLNNIYKSNK